jgi:hypothetical protein
MMELLHFCFKNDASGATTILVLIIVLGGIREIVKAIFRRRVK